MPYCQPAQLVALALLVMVTPVRSSRQQSLQRQLRLLLPTPTGPQSQAWLPHLGVGWPVGWWARLSAVPLLLLLRADGSVGQWAWLLAGSWMPLLGERWPEGWWAQLLAVPLLLLLRADGSVGRWAWLLVGRWLPLLGVKWPAGWWAQLSAVRADGSVGRWA
jgi:hypothetical protein